MPLCHHRCLTDIREGQGSTVRASENAGFDPPDDDRRRWLHAGVGLVAGLVPGLGSGPAAAQAGPAAAGSPDPAGPSGSSGSSGSNDASGPFGLGVASGMPGSDRVVIWTRLVKPLALQAGAAASLKADDVAALGRALAEPYSTDEVEVRWRVTLDEAMRMTVASGRFRARPEDAHAVRVEVRGLAADRWYWYRFDVPGGQSRVGRTRTLAASRNVAGRLRVAVASCQNYEHGYFSAYRHLLQDEPDLIVHLGDYIYEKSWGKQLVRPLPLDEARTLADYRLRYALYRLDPDLQAAHAAAPWLVVWDDHEVSNDYAGWVPERLSDAGGFRARRSAAYQAWFEHMPVVAAMAPRSGETVIHQTVTVGDLVSFHLLDTRQYRSQQACPRSGAAGGNEIDPASCAALADPGRSMLGAAQESWLEGSFSRSRSRWNLIGQQTLLAPLVRPGNGAARIRTDGWDGYPPARGRLLEAIERSRLANPVVLGGDLHAFHVADLHVGARPDAPVLAAEFVTTSISSQAGAGACCADLLKTNPHLHHIDPSQRGYLRLDLRRDRLHVDLMGLDDVTRPDATVMRQAAWVVERGRPGVVAA